VRGTLSPSTGPDEGIRVTNQARVLLASFPEVAVTTSQVGRPDDGTDTTGLFNTEYFVDLKPKEQWRPVFHEDKEALIAAMNRELARIPGVIWNFSQPIADNMEEAVSGVKGQLALKIYGDDLRTLEAKGDQIVRIMRAIRGIQDLGLFRVVGQPNLDIAVDRQRAARHQVNVADVQECDPDCRRRQRHYASPPGRATIRPGDAISRALPRHETSHRTHPSRVVLRRTRSPLAVGRRSDPRRRERDLSRSQHAVRRHQMGATCSSGCSGLRVGRRTKRRLERPSGR
jgi:hypothetical protein